MSHRAHPQDTAFLSGDLIYVASPLSSTDILVEMELVIFQKNNAKLYQTYSKIIRTYFQENLNQVIFTCLLDVRVFLEKMGNKQNYKKTTSKLTVNMVMAVHFHSNQNFHFRLTNTKQLLLDVWFCVI